MVDRLWELLCRIFKGIRWPFRMRIYRQNLWNRLFCGSQRHPKRSFKTRELSRYLQFIWPFFGLQACALKTFFPKIMNSSKVEEIHMYIFAMLTIVLDRNQKAVNIEWTSELINLIFIAFLSKMALFISNLWKKKLRFGEGKWSTQNSLVSNRARIGSRWLSPCPGGFAP